CMGEVVKEDLFVAQIVEEHAAKSEEVKKQPTSTFLKDNFWPSRIEESPLGNWITDILGEALANEGVAVDIVFYNSGGLRSPIGPGFVTYGDIYSILPYENKLAVVSLTGKHIRKLVDMSVQTGGDNSFSLSGFTFELNEECEIIEMKIAGMDVEDDRVYNLATSDFLASKDGGFNAKLGLAERDIRIYEDKESLRDIIFNYLYLRDQNVESSIEDFYNSLKPRQSFPVHCQ
ncbi:MAG: 5'-nucleotidase, partial [Halobacteriovoraceae bacterium]|nr:5'-nucleotidase [Halobacteriovoraceae bacterium]